MWLASRCLHRDGSATACRAHSLSPSYQVTLTLVGVPYQFLSVGLGGGGQMHTQKALSLFVAVCLGFISRGVWMVSAGGGAVGQTPRVTELRPIL